ncbi:MAG: hypothetical protein AB3K77_06320 [Methanosarcinaceae archaeon]
MMSVFMGRFRKISGFGLQMNDSEGSGNIRKSNIATCGYKGRTRDKLKERLGSEKMKK